MKKETLPEIVWPDIKGNEEPPYVIGATVLWVILPFPEGIYVEVSGPPAATKREAILKWNEMWG